MRTGGRYPCFDGLRAVAACSVILFHLASFTTRFRGSSGWYLQALGMGVWIFFVISGFLLYRPFVRAHLGVGADPDVRTYALRRVARIYPAYWVVLGYFTLVSPWAHIHGTGTGVLHVLLLQTYVPNQRFAGIDVAWSLVAEVSFYVFLPVFAAGVAALGRRWRPIAAEVTGLVFVFAVGIGTQAWDVFGRPPAPIEAFPIYLYVFGLGMLLAVATTRPQARTLPAAVLRLGDHAWVSWLVAFGFVVIVYRWHGGAHRSLPSDGIQLLLYVCRALAAFFVVLPGVVGAQDRGAIRRALRSRPAVYLGTISYGLYLWHPFTIQAIQRDWLGQTLGRGNPFVLLVVAGPVVIAVATLSWYLVERPILRLAHRTGDRSAAPPPRTRAKVPTG